MNTYFADQKMDFQGYDWIAPLEQIWGIIYATIRPYFAFVKYKKCYVTKSNQWIASVNKQVSKQIHTLNPKAHSREDANGTTDHSILIPVVKT